jgi:hypothetical protein
LPLALTIVSVFLLGSVKIKRNGRGRPFYILIVAAKVYAIRIGSAMADDFSDVKVTGNSTLFL